MIKRWLCALAFRKLSIIEQVASVEVHECTRCKRRWAVETERQQVYELKRERA